MPFYDLKCRGCNNEFNIMAKMKEREEKLVRCPDCGSTELDTVYKSVNIVKPSKSKDMPACPNAHVCGNRCSH